MSASPFIFHVPPPPKVRPPEVVHAAAMARGAQCLTCPLYGCGEGPVMGELRPDSKLMVVGDAPGEHEVKQGRPFVGWSGAILETSLAQGGLIRAQASLTNTILCRPPDGHYQAYIEQLTLEHKRAVARAVAAGHPVPPAPVLPQDACRPRLARDIEEVGARVTMAVGKQALENCTRVFGLAQGAAQVSPGAPYVATIRKQHGAPVVLPDGRGVLMSSYHPAMTVRGNKKFLPVIRENLARGAALATQDGHLSWTEPKYELSPTPAEVVAFCRQLIDRRLEVTCDIETGPAPGRTDKKAGIDVYSNIVRCVGIGATFPDGRERVMVVPFRHMDGTSWWSTQEEMLTCAYALREVLDTCPLIFHNGQFDTNVLLRVGLMTARMKPWEDTMLMHHDTPDNDLQHDLGFVARRYFCFPMWKSDIDHKSTDNVNDATLHLYGGRDVLITMRCANALRKTMTQHDTWPQYETDRAMGPALREMGNLGLVIDEVRRGQFCGALTWQVQRELYQFREQIGYKDFNPQSVPKLKQLIFQDWGYVPVLGADGYEIKRPDGFNATWKSQLLAEADADEAVEIEEEVGSTSSAALIELKKKREMKPEHAQAIDTLLEFRAYAKLLGTYVNNLPVRPVDWAAYGREYDEAVGQADEVSALVWDGKLGEYTQQALLGQRRALSLLNTSYKAQVIPTGRLCTQPAVQNWPALGKANMREMVVAAPGHVLVGADYEQLEARLYAVAARDALLLQAIRDGKDIHSLNAASLLAKGLHELEYWYQRVEHGEGIEPSKRKKYRKYWRTVAKRFAFLEIYGGSENKLFSVMASQRNKVTGELDFPGLKPNDVSIWHNNWHTLHPWTKAWHGRCHAFFERTGYSQVETLDMRKRFFLGGADQPNAIPNMTIQGFAASIANRALLRLVQAIPFGCWSPWTGLNLQVHDFLGVQVPEAKAQETCRILEDAMYFEYQGVPFPAVAGVSRRWSGQD